ncbi:hypothetical protein DRQ09_05720 [candidate division KSB1 bacterium]|nr:MAG: hypothetical protein DRQ09_05720 [candidate division KSB1 bacterium]
MHNNLVRVLITGCHSIIGQWLIKRCQGKFYVLGTSKDESTPLKKERFEYIKLDVTSRKMVKEVFKKFNPRFVVNTAGMNCIERCENEKEQCWKINVDSVNNLTYYSKFVNAKFIHISSSFIFDGKKGNYIEEDRPFPTTYYGKSKLASENIVKSSGLEWSIIRTSFIYGKDTIKKSKCFVDNLLNQVKQKNKIDIEENIILNPTYIGNFVDAVWKIIKLEKSGVFHIAGRETSTLEDFIKKIITINGFDSNLVQLKDKNNSIKNFGMIVTNAEKELNMKFLNVEEGLRFYFL